MKPVTLEQNTSGRWDIVDNAARYALHPTPHASQEELLHTFPGQPEIIELLITEGERVLMNAMEAQAANEYAALQAQAAAGHTVTVSADVYQALVAAGIIK